MKAKRHFSRDRSRVSHPLHFDTAEPFHNYPIAHSTANDGVEYYYSVRDIVFFLENADGSFAEYRRKVCCLCWNINHTNILTLYIPPRLQAVQHRVTAVVEQDRKQLKSYLSGELESCPQIDQDMVNKYKMAQQAIEKNSGASRIETDASQVNISQVRIIFRGV